MQLHINKYTKAIIYGSVTIIFMLILYFISVIFQPTLSNSKPDMDMVTNTIFEDTIPAVKEEKVIIKPYTDEEVKIVKSFYDYKADTTSQINSIVYYEGTYLQNSGVDYAGTQKFDVNSIMDGTVIKVLEDKLLGNIVEIRHNNDLISVYQSLAEVKVKNDDVISKGQIIGISGYASIAPNLKEHLHFEVLYKGEVINPESIFNKTIDKIEDE